MTNTTSEHLRYLFIAGHEAMLAWVSNHSARNKHISIDTINVVAKLAGECPQAERESCITVKSLRYRFPVGKKKQLQVCKMYERNINLETGIPIFLWIKINRSSSVQAYPIQESQLSVHSSDLAW